MQFQHLKHVVAHIQNRRENGVKKSPNSPYETFIQMHICLLIKRKRNIGICTAKLTILWYDKYSTSLQSNGMAAIPKI